MLKVNVPLPTIKESFMNLNELLSLLNQLPIKYHWLGNTAIKYTGFQSM
jgi:hypothetical protein